MCTYKAAIHQICQSSSLRAKRDCPLYLCWACAGVCLRQLAELGISVPQYGSQKLPVQFWFCYVLFWTGGGENVSHFNSTNNICHLFFSRVIILPQTHFRRRVMLMEFRLCLPQICLKEKIQRLLNRKQTEFLKAYRWMLAVKWSLSQIIRTTALWIRWS